MKDISPEPPRPLSLMGLAKTGYWFCKECQMIVGVEFDEDADSKAILPTKSCQRCGSPRVEWNKPV